MLELMKKYYEQVQALKNAYDAADEQKDEAGKVAAREQYHQWKDTVIAEGEDFWRVRCGPCR